MTPRATVIGLLLGLAIAAFGYLNDWALRLPGVACNLVPLSVFGLLVLGMLVLNPLAGLLRLRRLSAAEWCVILALMLVACVIPGPGLMWQFTETIVRPHFNHDRDPANWEKSRLLDYAPPILLVDASKDRQRVVYGFMNGVNLKSDFPPIREVPWAAFYRTLSFWMPLLALGMVATICVMFILHGQWAHRERLRYPVAEFASELLTGAGQSRVTSILRDRRFWLGFSVAFGILIINGLKSWFPRSVEIPLQFNLGAVTNHWPELTRIRFYWNLFQPRIFFVALGFAYFVSSDVSFTIGISHWVFAVAWLAALDADLSVAGHYIGGGAWDYQIFGSYLGMTAMILYVGRRFYGGVLRGMLGRSGGPESVRAGLVWAARAGVLAALAMVGMLVVVVRLHWLPAVLFVLLTGMLYLVLTRINVETGLIIIQPKWQAVEIITALLGFNALGPNLYIIVALLSVVTHIDPRSTLMPMVANSLRFSEPKGVRLGRLSGWMVVAVLAALGVGMFATIYVQYGFGEKGHFWWAPDVGNFSFEMLIRNIQSPEFVRDSGPGWYNFSWAHIRPDGMFLASAGVGLALVLACSVLRLRFPWWPIHPLLFLIWGVDTVTPLCFSFLLGWALKSFITRFGGGEAFRKYKPFFVGLVAGEFLAGITWAAVGLVYYLATGLYGAASPILTGDIPRR